MGMLVLIIGASGSGKSTLLRCINLLEEATGGTIIYRGKDISSKEVAQRNPTGPIPRQ